MQLHAQTLRVNTVQKRNVKITSSTQASYHRSPRLSIITPLVLDELALQIHPTCFIECHVYPVSKSMNRSEFGHIINPTSLGASHLPVTSSTRVPVMNQRVPNHSYMRPSIRIQSSMSLGTPPFLTPYLSYPFLSKCAFRWNPAFSISTLHIWMPSCTTTLSRRLTLMTKFYIAEMASWCH